MKDTALKELQRVVNDAKRKRHPSVPDHALPRTRYSDKDANGLTKCVVDFVNLQPACLAWRSGNAPVFDAKIGQHRAGNVRKGVADVTAIRQGRAWQIEVKVGADRLSDHQKKFAAEVEAAGGIYCVATSFEGFVRRWNEETPTL